MSHGPGHDPNWPTVSVNLYSIYGSRYRKAKANKGWGVFLSVVAAPLSGVLLAYGIDEGGVAPAVLGGPHSERRRSCAEFLRPPL